MRRLTDPLPPASPDAKHRRDRLTRISDLRRTLRTGSLLVAGILLITGFLLAARFPTRAIPLFVLWTAGAGIAFGLYLASGRTSRRFVVPLTIVFTLIPTTALNAVGRRVCRRPVGWRSRSAAGWRYRRLAGCTGDPFWRLQFRRCTRRRRRDGIACQSSARPSAMRSRDSRKIVVERPDGRIPICACNRRVTSTEDPARDGCRHDSADS